MAKLHQALQEDAELIKTLETAIEISGKRKTDKESHWRDQRALLYYSLKQDLGKVLCSLVVMILTYIQQTSQLIDKISAEYNTAEDQVKKELLYWKGVLTLLYSLKSLSFFIDS